MERVHPIDNETYRLFTMKQRRSWLSRIHIVLLLMALPTVVYIFLFHYLPIGGLIIAFKNYNSFQGFASPWTTMGGFQHFYDFITSPNFWTVMKNTLILSIMSIVFNTITPIIFALLVNEVVLPRFKRLAQTIMYAPYFISTVVLVGMLFVFFDKDSGVFTKIFMFFGMKPQNLMENPDAFALIYVISGVWQGLGWWSITYMGTLSNVDPNLRDAATIDGAGRIRRILHVNLPAIIPLATIMLIMSIGNILSVGFEKVYLMQVASNLSSSEIIATYVYRVSFPKYGMPQFSYATAIGLFNSLINIVILVVANTISRKVSETSLW